MSQNKKLKKNIKGKDKFMDTNTDFKTIKKRLLIFGIFAKKALEKIDVEN